MRNSECGVRAKSARFLRGERDRPGCRFRRRAENPFPKLNGSTNGSGATPEPARETRALPLIQRTSRRDVPAKNQRYFARPP
jgi:hypothetical protein